MSGVGGFGLDVLDKQAQKQVLQCIHAPPCCTSRGVEIMVMLAHLESRGIVKRVCSLHSGVYSFLHASLLNHKKIKTSKEVYSPCASPPSPMNQESLLREDGGFYLLGFTRET